MAKNTLSVLAFTAALGFSGAAGAGLIDRGGGLIYDDVLNITWLQDANYAQTSGYDADGRMTWDAAVAWADQLSYYDTVRGVTYDDWRLPFVVDTGAPGVQCTYDGADCGYNVQTADTNTIPVTVYSELAYMFHVNLGNLSAYTTAGVFRGGFSGTDWGVVNTSFVDAQTSQLRSFQHFLNDVYWSGTEYAPNPGNAWYFDANSGSQFAGGENTGFYAWAVRPGDVAAAPPSIPEPGSLALVGLGLVVLGFAQRRG